MFSYFARERPLKFNYEIVRNKLIKKYPPPQLENILKD
jgi:hypothetical protein